MKKRFLSLLLTLAMLLTMVPIAPVTAADIYDYGTCGNNVTWTWDTNGTLTISGTGEMDFHYNGPPWYAYKNSITTVVIEKGVTNIDHAAFEECINLTQITIPDSVTSIGNSAFEDCTSLTEIAIPDSVTSIGGYAFDGCDNLTYQIYDNAKYLGNLENPYMALVGPAADAIGSVVLHPETKLICGYVFSDCTSLAEIVIPEGITSISERAFSNCTSLTNVVIPDSVTRINRDAFGNCTNLTDVTFGKNSQLTSIGEYAFCGCTSLTHVEIPSCVTSIEEGAFAGCTGLTSVEIPEGVTSILSVFHGCENLTSVVIPVSLKSVGWSSFGYTDLTDVYYNGTTDQWSKISIDDYNENFVYAAVHYLSGITITKTGKTEYCVGEALDTTDMVVTADYSDGSSRTVTSYTIIGYDANTLGEQTVTVTFGKKTATFTVTVKVPMITGIAVTAPNKTEYWVGEKLDTTGMEVFAIYSNGDTELVTNYSVSGYNANTAGEQAITVTYKNFSNTFTVVVKKPYITNYNMRKLEKLEYWVGEALDVSEMFVAIYSDNSFEYITEGYTITGYDANVPGQQKVTINFKGMEATYTVTVKEPVVTDIAVSVPSRTEYWTGEELNTDGMVVTVTYSDGSTKTVTEGFEIAGYDASIPGGQTVTVTYDGYTASFPVTVKENVVTGFSVIPPAKTEYWVGEELDITGMAATAVYSDGSTQAITEFTVVSEDAASEEVLPVMLRYSRSAAVCTVTGYDANKIGEQVVTVAFESVTDTFNVTVKEITVTGISATTPIKTEYWVGEELDTTGMVVTVSYSDGSTETVTDYTVSGYDANTSGDQLVTVTYGEFTDTFTVTVTTPTSGFCGENLTWELVDGTLTISGNGAMEIFTNSWYLPPWTPFKDEITKLVIEEGVLNAGDYAFYELKNLASVSLPNSLMLFNECAFTGCTALTSLTIPEGVESIGFDAFGGCTGLKDVSLPDTLERIDGYAFSRCENLTSVVIPKNVRRIGEYAFTECASLKEITIPASMTEIWEGAFFDCTALTDVYYGGTAVQWVQILIEGENDPLTGATLHTTEVVTGITVTAPTKKQYVVGEELDTTGMVVTATYSDGSTKTVTDYSVSGYDANTPGEQTVTVAYEGFTATFCVCVQEKVLYGDVNGDGEVNTRDRAILTRYLADWEGYAHQIDLKAADVNGDGSVDTRDRAILTRYLADWENYPELPYTG